MPGLLPTWWHMLLVPCPNYPQLTPSSLERTTRGIRQLSADNSVSDAFLSHFLCLKTFWGPEVFARNTTWKRGAWEFNAPWGWTEWFNTNLWHVLDGFQGAPCTSEPQLFTVAITHSQNMPVIGSSPFLSYFPHFLQCAFQNHFLCKQPALNLYLQVYFRRNPNRDSKIHVVATTVPVFNYMTFSLKK